MKKDKLLEGLKHEVNFYANEKMISFGESDRKLTKDEIDLIAHNLIFEHDELWSFLHEIISKEVHEL